MAVDAALNAFLQAMANRRPMQAELPEGVGADSTYLAFLRGMGVSEDQAWSSAHANINAIRNQYAASGESLRTQGEQARKNIGDNYLTRGAWRSGTRLEDTAKQRGLEEAQRAEMEQNYAGQIGGQQTGLNERLADLARSRAEQVGNLQERGTRREQEAKLTTLQTLAALSPEQASAFRAWTGHPDPPAPPTPSFSFGPAAPPPMTDAASRWIAGLKPKPRTFTEHAGLAGR